MFKSNARKRNKLLIFIEEGEDKDDGMKVTTINVAICIKILITPPLHALFIKRLATLARNY